MGYMGLKHWDDSDMASGTVIGTFEAIAKSLEKELKDDGNEYNTSGCVNVAFYNEQFIYPIIKNVAEVGSTQLLRVLQKAQKKLDKELKDVDTWDDVDNTNKDMHKKAYRRLLKKLKVSIEEIES